METTRLHKHIRENPEAFKLLVRRIYDLPQDEFCRLIGIMRKDGSVLIGGHEYVSKDGQDHYIMGSIILEDIPSADQDIYEGEVIVACNSRIDLDGLDDLAELLLNANVVNRRKIQQHYSITGRNKKDPQYSLGMGCFGTGKSVDSGEDPLKSFQLENYEGLHATLHEESSQVIYRLE
jgi:hypothetical protein